MTTRTVVITGASRGIGAALAEAFAAPGTLVVLVARDAERLEAVASACRARGGETEILAADIRDRDAMRDALLRLDARHPVDLVVANAGVALPTGDDREVERASYGEVEVNLVGTLNTILPLIPAMSARGRGQIALVSSLAAFSPLPDSPGYCGTKAALLAYGLSMRERLRTRGVRVNVVCPGYVFTAMGGRYSGWRPLEMSAARAASRIVAGLARDKPVIAFPRSLALVARLSTFVPERVMRLGLSGFRFRIDER